MVCLYFGMQVETERKPHQCAMQKISGKVILGGHVFLEVGPLRRGGGEGMTGKTGLEEIFFYYVI